MSKVADFLKDFFNFFYRVRLRSEKIDRLIDNHEESVSAIKDIKQNIIKILFFAYIYIYYYQKNNL